MNKILIIEDEENVSHIIKAYLEKEGYGVTCCNTGLEGLRTFMEGSFQLIILDLMLPDISGEEVCRRIREKSNENNSEFMVYIFMLTAKGSINDRISGYDLGADEYLVKPFSPRELTARVNALFRRMNKEGDAKTLGFDDGSLRVDYHKRSVTLKGLEIPFTPNEFDILYTLIAAKGRVLSRDQLINMVFGIDFEGYDRTVDVHIKNIRKKIEEDTRNPKYIVTVTKVGYKFGGDK